MLIFLHGLGSKSQQQKLTVSVSSAFLAISRFKGGKSKRNVKILMYLLYLCDAVMKSQDALPVTAKSF